MRWTTGIFRERKGIVPCFVVKIILCSCNNLSWNVNAKIVIDKWGSCNLKIKGAMELGVFYLLDGCFNVNVTFCRIFVGCYKIVNGFLRRNTKRKNNQHSQG